ncbi:MAG: HEAT repeat domain-containing protein [Chlamydiales bacterium]|nr:HEAT repeat domain-containing protein [Chlamydiales bacterium]
MNDDNAILFDSYPLADDIDCTILMHRDAHFSGKFSFMIDYYAQEGKGALVEIPLERISYLAHAEEIGQQNLSPLLLSGKDAESVARAKTAYKQLRDLYETETSENSHLKLIADLILSEEEIPEKEVAAIVKEGSSMLPGLINLLTTEEFLDPLFPGYGYGPELAAIALGKIGHESAIIPLFETLGREGFFIEEAILEALKNIGASAKNFLIQALISRPITLDNEKAAMALTYFSEDEEIAPLALQQLQAHSIVAHPQLATYLILMCEGLKAQEERTIFKNLSSDPIFSDDLTYEMKMIIRSWKDNTLLK